MSQDASFLEGADSALYLGAFTPEDIDVISTILQDGIFCINDLAWLKKKRQVAVLVSRFRWENKSEYIEKNSALLVMVTHDTRLASRCKKQYRLADQKLTQIA